MIDLIIPYYNNPEGIIRTIESVNKDIFYITIVDDNSSIYLPYNINADQVLRYNQNKGPGCARQHGIDKTHNEYMMFLDTGDIFISKEIQEYILQVIKANPQENVISFPYYYKSTITSDADNRMHGKVYKRAFIEKYGITFAPEGSYMNEDIGFNHTCRLCTDILYMSKPVIKWVENTDSLTQKNNQQVLYKDQTRALSINIIHTVETCRAHNVDIKDEIQQIACALYYWVIRAVLERPEFAQEAWSGAKIFFDRFNDDIHTNELLVGNAYLKQIWQYKRNINFPINILKFVGEMSKYETIPSYYLT